MGYNYYIYYHDVKSDDVIVILDDVKSDDVIKQ